MIEIGDIVFRVESDIVNFGKIGLVLDKQDFHGNQYKVQFVGSPACWWEERYLYKIEGEENDS